MKLQRVSIFVFAFYVLLTLSFAAYCIWYVNSINENFNYDKNASPVVISLIALSYAIQEMGKTLGTWLQFVIAALIFNFLYYTSLMWLRKFSLKELIFIISITLCISIGLFIFVFIIFQWSLGEYFNIIFPLLVATFYVSKKTGLFLNTRQPLFSTP